MKRVTFYHYFLVIFFLLGLVVTPFSAYAGTVLFSGNNICQYIGSIYTFGTSAVGILSVLMIMIGGGFYLYSAGNEERVNIGKEMIYGAIAGLVLMFITIIFFNTLSPNILQCRNTLNSTNTGSTAGTGTNLAGLNNTAPNTRPGEFKNVTAFKQDSGPYANHPYVCKNPTTAYEKSGTIARAGCAPTAAAMALSAYGVNTNPAQVADHFADSGYRTCSNGTYGTALVSGLNKWGYQGSYTSYDGAKKAAGDGYMVIGLARGSSASNKNPDTRDYFTKGGHYVVLSGYKDGRFRVNNPSTNGREGWTDERAIKSDIYTYWVIKKK